MIAENNPLSMANEIIRLTKSGYYIRQAMDKIGVSDKEFIALVNSQPALAEHIEKNFQPFLAKLKPEKYATLDEVTEVKKRGKNTIREDK